MTQSTFVERRKPGWDRLEHLLKAIERRGLRKLAPEDICLLYTSDAADE